MKVLNTMIKGNWDYEWDDCEFDFYADYQENNMAHFISIRLGRVWITCILDK